MDERIILRHDKKTMYQWVVLLIVYIIVFAGLAIGDIIPWAASVIVVAIIAFFTCFFRFVYKSYLLELTPERCVYHSELRKSKEFLLKDICYIEVTHSSIDATVAVLHLKGKDGKDLAEIPKTIKNAEDVLPFLKKHLGENIVKPKETSDSQGQTDTLCVYSIKSRFISWGLYFTGILIIIIYFLIRIISGDMIFLIFLGFIIVLGIMPGILYIEAFKATCNEHKNMRLILTETTCSYTDIDGKVMNFPLTDIVYIEYKASQGYRSRLVWLEISIKDKKEPIRLDCDMTLKNVKKVLPYVEKHLNKRFF